MSSVVLVFGNNRDARMTARRALAAEGYRVLLASSTAEAAKCLAAGDVALIVALDMCRDSARHESRQIPADLVTLQIAPHIHIIAAPAAETLVATVREILSV